MIVNFQGFRRANPSPRAPIERVRGRARVRGGRGGGWFGQVLVARGPDNAKSHNGQKKFQFCTKKYLLKTRAIPSLLVKNLQSCYTKYVYKFTLLILVLKKALLVTIL